MKQLFLDIQNTIQANVSGVKWIDIDEGQLEAFGENAPVDYPCVLVDFPNGNFTEAADALQIGEIQINIKVAFRVYERLNTSVPTALRDQAFRHFNILQSIMQVIHGIEGDFYSPLTRVSFSKEVNSIDPKVYNITFETAISDNALQPTKQVTTAPVSNIDAQYQ